MITAIEAKTMADDRNNKAHLAELNQVTRSIEGESAKGNYNFSNSGSISIKTIDKLKQLGYNVETSSHMNESNYSITWLKAVEPVSVAKPKLFYSNTGLFGVAKKFADDKIPFVKALIKQFDNVCWGGINSKHWSSSSFNDVVVVYEAGIRGPADWFFVNDENKWCHGGYSAYKETYSDIEFEDMIKTTSEANKEYK